MNDDEVIAELFSRLVMLTNQMKSCGEKVTQLQKLEKNSTSPTNQIQSYNYGH